MSLTKQKEQLLEKLLSNPKVLALLEEENNEAEEKSNIKTFKCQDCGHKLTSEKNRRKCPECKKHKLKEVLTPVTGNNPEVFKDTVSHKQPVSNIKTQFIDPGGSQNNQDKEITEKINNGQINITGRRNPFRKVKMTCYICRREFEVNSIYSEGGFSIEDTRREWKCNSCMKAKPRSR